jgi:hypothetical protein
MDLQEIKSTLWRQTLDNLYLANNPQWEVVAGQVEIDDLLISRPGGIKRVKAPGMLRALETPFVAGNTMPMIDYIDKVRELRTGMPEAGGELSADVLNNSATGANIVNNTRLERVELITRTFAETGVKQAFKRILELVQKYQDQKQTIKLRGNWVDVDPREWRTEFDMQIQVGLGSGNKDQMLAHLMPIKQTQEQILLQLGPQNPLVSLQNYFHTLAAMVKNANLGDVDQYFQNPSQQPPQPPQPPKPDPAAQKAQMDAQIAQQQGQQQMQLAQAKAQLEQQVAQQKMGLEQQRAQQEMQINQQQAEHQMQLQAMKVRADIEIAQVKAQADIAVAQRKDAMQIAAAKDGVDVE